MKQYFKLVRDRIPEIIEADGKTCVCKTLSDEDYISILTSAFISVLSFKKP